MSSVQTITKQKKNKGQQTRMFSIVIPHPLDSIQMVFVFILTKMMIKHEHLFFLVLNNYTDTRVSKLLYILFQ